MFKKTRVLPPAAKPAPPAAPVVAPIPEKRPMSLNQLGEKDTQPLFHRFTMGANAAAVGRTRLPIFNTTKNLNPDLTNLEVASAMPNTSRFTSAAIEIRVNPNTTAAALAMFLAHTRLAINVGAKNYEKLNQPTIMFAGLGGVKNIAGLDFSTSTPQGLYTFNPGEEIVFQESQTFDARFEVDPAGFVLGAADVLDIVVVLKGQKQAVVAL